MTTSIFLTFCNDDIFILFFACKCISKINVTKMTNQNIKAKLKSSQHFSQSVSQFHLDVK